MTFFHFIYRSTEAEIQGTLRKLKNTLSKLECYNFLSRSNPAKGFEEHINYIKLVKMVMSITY